MALADRNAGEESLLRRRLAPSRIRGFRREVRLVRVGGHGKTVVLQRCGFSELARAERDGVHVRLWDSNNVFLAEVSLADRTVMTSLMAGLRAAGKVA